MRLIFFTLIILISFTKCKAQTSLTYDASGNRLAKIVTGAIPQPTVTATPAVVGPNQPSTLQAQECPGGTISWSTGHQGASFVAYPCQSQAYIAYCQVASCPNQRSSAQAIVEQTNPLTNTILTSEKSGNWNDPTVWCCGRIPTLTDKVIIYPTHTVTITDNTAQAKNLGFELPGSRLKYLSTGKLRVSGN